MDGRGRALDNIFVERLWRSVKYEDIYLKNYDSVRDLDLGLLAYFHFYNHDRPHQALAYHTPAEVHLTRPHLLPNLSLLSSALRLSLSRTMSRANPGQRREPLPLHSSLP